MAGAAPTPNPVRDAKALALKLKGWTYQEIADELDVAKSSAYDAVQRALTTEIGDQQENRDRYRAEQVAQCDVALKGLYAKVEAGDPRAIDSWVRVLDRKAKVLGLDAPLKLVVTDQMDAEIEQLLEEAARLERIAAEQEAAAAAERGELPPEPTS